MTRQEWLALGFYQTVNGHQVFVIDTARQVNDQEPANNTTKIKPILCLLHGFPTSSFDYYKVLNVLSVNYRVIVHDHLGFGFSDKPIDYSYSLIDQTDIALILWQSLGITQKYLLAHDYGTSILTEILARDNQGFWPIKITKIILCNGSIHIEMAKLRLMQKLLRNKLLGPLVAKLSNKKTLKHNLEGIFFDPTKINQQEIDDIWYLMTFKQGKKVLAQISRYTLERKALWFRWISAIQQTQLPIEIIWPENDPIAVAEMANTIHKETQNSTLTWLPKLGHFPMLEAPELWCEKVLNALAEHQ